MMLVSRIGLVEDNAIEVFNHYGVHFSYYFMQNFKSFQRKYGVREKEWLSRGNIQREGKPTQSAQHPVSA